MDPDRAHFWLKGPDPLKKVRVQSNGINGTQKRENDKHLSKDMEGKKLSKCNNLNRAYNFLT